MVDRWPSTHAPLAGAWLLAVEGARPIERLDPVLRAKVLMALLGLVILGLGMIVLIVLSARYVRRYLRGPGFGPTDDGGATTAPPTSTPARGPKRDPK